MIDFENDVLWESEEVALSKLDNVGVNEKTITDLVAISRKTQRGRVRFCAHRDPSAAQHEMFIVHPRHAYIPPHMHSSKSESLLVLAGIVDYFIFDNTGLIVQKIRLGDLQSGNCFYYRLNNSIYHSMLIHSETLVFLETSRGPFVREETHVAPWAPVDGDGESQDQFLGLLKNWKPSS